MWDHDRVIHLALAVLKIGARGKKVEWAIGFPEVPATRKSQKIIFPCCIFPTHSFVQKIRLENNVYMGKRRYFHRT